MPQLCKAEMSQHLFIDMSELLWLCTMKQRLVLRALTSLLSRLQIECFFYALMHIDWIYYVVHLAAEVAQHLLHSFPFKSLWPSLCRINRHSPNSALNIYCVTVKPQVQTQLFKHVSPHLPLNLSIKPILNVCCGIHKINVSWRN